MLWIDQYRLPVSTDPEVLVKYFQSTGAGTSGFSINVPTGAQDGDVAILIVRHDDPITSIETGFSVKENFTYLSPNQVSVLTGTYASGTHGGPGSSLDFSYTGTGVTIMYSWWCRNVVDTTSGFNSGTPTGTNANLPSVTASGEGIAFSFCFEAPVDNIDTLNGWTQDHYADSIWALHQIATGAGTLTGAQFDDIRFIESVGVFLAKA